MLLAIDDTDHRAVMFGTHNLAAFTAASILLSITPGQDTFYILGRSIAGGRRAGVLSARGIATGALAHVIAAAVGLSALLASSDYAFTVVKYVGAAYLIYLGVKMLCDDRSETRGDRSYERPGHDSRDLPKGGPHESAQPQGRSVLSSASSAVHLTQQSQPDGIVPVFGVSVPS